MYTSDFTSGKGFFIFQERHNKTGHVLKQSDHIIVEKTDFWSVVPVSITMLDAQCSSTDI